jgi:threonine dehydrogenase-like Zn-dependent dehydrogenase
VGLGIIGHLALQHAVARGAWAIGIDIDESRLQLARQAGALHAINGRERDTVQQVMSITEGGAHVAFDATGIASMLESTSKYLRPRPWDGDPAACSRLVLQGSLEDPVSVDYWALFMPELDLIVPRDCDTQDLVDSLSLMATGSIRPEIIPATTYSYRDAAEAYPRLVDREIMRVLFSWE